MTGIRQPDPVQLGAYQGWIDDLVVSWGGE